MEVTRARISLLSAMLAALLVGIKYQPPLGRSASGPARTERWMEDSLPTEVAGLKMIPSRQNPRQSYRADQHAYSALKPYGIVCRVYGTRRFAVGVTAIAGDSIDTFHDQESCLKSHEWNFVDGEIALARTKLHGDVPVHFLTLHGPGGDRLAAYCYKRRSVYYGRRGNFLKDWLKGELIDGKEQEGTYYLFAQASGSNSEPRLLSFIAVYFDQATTLSNDIL